MTLDVLSLKQDTEQITFETKLVYSCFSASKIIDDFEFGFKQFINELVDYYNKKRDSARLRLLERQLDIDICNEGDQMICGIQLNVYQMDNIMCQSFLNVKYEIDQSFLPELIDEISQELKSNENIL